MRKINEEIYKKVKKLDCETLMPKDDIAAAFGISYSTISNIRRSSSFEEYKTMLKDRQEAYRKKVEGEMVDVNTVKKEYGVVKRDDVITLAIERIIDNWELDTREKAQKIIDIIKYTEDLL